MITEADPGLGKAIATELAGADAGRMAPGAHVHLIRRQCQSKLSSSQDRAREQWLVMVGLSES